MTIHSMNLLSLRAHRVRLGTQVPADQAIAPHGVPIPTDTARRAPLLLTRAVDLVPAHNLRPVGTTTMIPTTEADMKQSHIPAPAESRSIPIRQRNGHARRVPHQPRILALRVTLHTPPLHMEQISKNPRIPRARPSDDRLGHVRAGADQFQFQSRRSTTARLLAS